VAETKLIYFAWVRERIGKPDEEIALPVEVKTVKDLLGFLKARGDGYEAALRYPEVIRVAINQEHVEHDTPIAGAREIALFPPMTGG
jgi:sulfur-carrier protein